MDDTIIIKKGQSSYPLSLIEAMGDDAPDTLILRGNIDLLSARKGAIIGSNVEITEDNIHKIKTAVDANRKSHALVEMDTTVSNAILPMLMDREVIIMMDGTVEYDNYDDEVIRQMNHVLANDGLLIAYDNDDPHKGIGVYYCHQVMVAMSDALAVPLISNRDKEIINVMDYAKSLEKKVLINKEEYINLNK